MILVTFIAGAVVAGFALAGLFFLKFWKRTRDELFLAFTAAFWLLGITQALLTFSHVPVEERTWLYLLRLAPPPMSSPQFVSSRPSGIMPRRSGCSAGWRRWRWQISPPCIWRAPRP